MKAIKFPVVVKVGNVSVKIYRTKSAEGYSSYQVADYSQGKRRLRTFSALMEARDRAEQIARGLSSGDVVALELSSNDRAAYGRAIELLRDTGTPIELAAARYADAVKILGDGGKLVEAVRFYLARNPGALPSKPVAEVVAEIIATKEGRRKSLRYVSDLRSRLGRFADVFKGNIGDVTTAKVQGWLDGLKLAPRSYINYRRVVYSLFAFAEARGYIFKGSNPVEGVESIEANDGKTHVFTPGEIASLFKVVTTEFRPCLALGAFAGMRSAEIERIEWTDIDLAGGFVTVDPEKAKTASRRTIPICGALAGWLAVTPESERQGRVWKGEHDSFYDAQQAAAGLAGIKWKANALRHSYASYRLAEINDDSRVAQELGNSRSVVHRHYKELVKPAQAAAWFSIKPDVESNVIGLKVA